MRERTKLGRRLAAVLAAAALLLLLVLAWGLRPALPPMPHSFSQPLPGRTISSALDLAAWTVAALLDLVLLGSVVRFALRKTPSGTELRLRRAFAWREPPPIARRDWRTHAAPLAPPMLRLPSRHESESQAASSEMVPRSDPQMPPAPSAGTRDFRDGLPGVLLLGPLELAGCTKRQPRRQATTQLIAYLATHRYPASRDELLEALWPGDDPRRSAARFYQAVSEARKLLGDAFQRDRDAYALDRNRLRVDLDQLARLRSEAESTMGDERLGLIERALGLFRGEPLMGIDALWAEGEQRQLTALRADMLEQAGRLRLDGGDAAGALAYAEAVAALDASNESPVRLAMEADGALGRREAVVERYEALVRTLEERFGLDPSRETRRLYRRLLGSDESSSSRAAETEVLGEVSLVGRPGGPDQT